MLVCETMDDCNADMSVLQQLPLAESLLMHHPTFVNVREFHSICVDLTAYRTDAKHLSNVYSIICANIHCLNIC
jgi:hypothetical protein